MHAGRLMRRRGWLCLPMVGLLGCAGETYFLSRQPARSVGSPTLLSQVRPALESTDAPASFQRPGGPLATAPVSSAAYQDTNQDTAPPSTDSGKPEKTTVTSGKGGPEMARPPETVSPPATPLTLDQIIQATLWADPYLRAGFESITQAQADLLTASLFPNPQLNISQTLMPLTRPFTPDKQGGPPQLDVGISYPIDWFLFGKRAAALQSAAIGVRVAEAEFADRVRQRILEAMLRYYDLLEAKALVDLARQDVENLRRVEGITLKAVEGGGRSRVELQRIQLDRLRAEQALREAERNRSVAAAQLRVLLGRNDADPAFDVAGSFLDIPPPALPDAEEAYRLATQERPDLTALRLQVQRADAQRFLEQSNAWPNVVPFLGYTRQFQRKVMEMPDASSFGFGMEASLPLFDRNQGNRNKAASVAVQSRLQLQAAEVALRAEIEQLFQELQTASSNVRSLAEEQLKLAAELRDSIVKAYEAGGRSLLDVLDAQRNYRDTYRLFITSRANLAKAIARFNAAVNRRLVP
jgi:cobalt-zinc-cadmium efflux system outer membrane protein